MLHNALTTCPAMAQAQCQKDLKGLSKRIESKQGDLESAQQELQEQQKTEAAMQKRISEAERRLQVHNASSFRLTCVHGHNILDQSHVCTKPA